MGLILRDVSCRITTGQRNVAIRTIRLPCLSDCCTQTRTFFLNMRRMGGKIPMHELNELMVFISAQFFLICDKWKNAFVVDEINFYC